MGSASTNIKDRWLQPLLVFIPAAMVVISLEGLPQKSHRIFMNIISGFFALVIVLTPINSLYGEPSSAAYRSAKFSDIVKGIEDEYPSVENIVVSSS